MSASAYPKPGPTGGRLIRELIAFLREHSVELPITSYILIAASGGSDSTALAHLLARYGRRVADPAKIGLLHVNHGWRGAESDGDELFVRDCARRWGIPVRVERLNERPGAGESWENHARAARKKIFAREASGGALILTAHQADDLAETLLWRLFTGSAATHGAGIAVRHEAELRPFLRFRKEELRQYLSEENEIWREDRTNSEGRLLRSRIRSELMPTIERLFPRAVENLVEQGLRAGAGQPVEFENLGVLLGAAGLRLKRSQWRMLEDSHAEADEVDLPGGWRLTRHPVMTSFKKVSSNEPQQSERPPLGPMKWVLEKKI